MGAPLFRACFDSMPGLYFFFIIIVIIISGHSRNACDVTSTRLLADRDSMLPWDHRHMVPVDVGKRSILRGTVGMISWVKLGLLSGTFLCLLLSSWLGDVWWNDAASLRFQSSDVNAV